MNSLLRRKAEITRGISRVSTLRVSAISPASVSFETVSGLTFGHLPTTSRWVLTIKVACLPF